ncbi:hypothetical protein [Tsukamurella paurometabola]|uniref:Uncharacterized protein n=1 Tax=Tsukamurella paurometabola TaxID=2061 RepID=A0A3P8KPP0_TSUPA|nr:hypothetical protein [Tsukamurella paurometabola]MBS4099983.1 hypothetical protein [Tsukamurella paurometabola]UEA85443.1 hypothetical protein LK411_11755 [Tsukamurella paurometabola]VDR38067.1 Uncharacterised protein [Tsukamurella paurometabola]
MIRVSIGPRANTAMVLVSGLFLVNAWFAAATGDKTVATIWVAAAVFVLVDITSSLKQRACALACASGLVVLSLAFALGSGDRLRIIGAALMVAFTAALIPWRRKRSGGGAVRTEELVGWTVADAERVLGYPKGLQPAGMDAPTLVPIPAGAAPPDLDDPAVRAELVVTAVALDPAVPSITFGVAPPHSVRRRDVTREEMQAELVARAGGFPGDLRPETRVLGAPRPR